MSENPYKSKKIFFHEGNTFSYDFRLAQLKKLQSSIREHEDEIINALSLDLSKPIFESHTAELGIVYEELNNAIKNLDSWMKVKKASTPMYLQFGKSRIYPQPKGVVFIISPWNYPFQLAISPLIGAIAAGNCIVLKPSNQSLETQKIISKIINKSFDSNYISVVEGPGSKVVSPLIEKYRFDHIFFTGSVSVGKEILKLSASHLTPVTLELGGKSPTIVHSDADIDMAAKKITWGKFYNLGQTCVAPDYILVHKSKKDLLIEKIIFYINKFYGPNIIESKDLGRIINNKRFDKLISFLNSGDILIGGNYDLKDKFIEPTLIHNVSMNDPIMKEEIFGPILPILSYDDISEVTDIIDMNPYPLALYLFTKSDFFENYIIETIQFGGGCINDTISHVGNSNLPFGGFGFSGMGYYHSKYTFKTFSHYKSIFKSNDIFDFNFKYPPYTEKNLSLVKKVLK